MNRYYRVHLNSDVSNVVAVDCGVPQGSPLGPKMFIAYVEDMDEIFAVHNVSHHCFADDTQSYTDGPLSQALGVFHVMSYYILTYILTGADGGRQATKVYRRRG